MPASLGLMVEAFFSDIGKYQFSKIPYFNNKFKNNSPAAGYYAITPFSENNMVKKWCLCISHLK